jgi:hypothetical protein
LLVVLLVLVLLVLVLVLVLLLLLLLQPVPRQHHAVHLPLLPHWSLSPAEQGTPAWKQRAAHR